MLTDFDDILYDWLDQFPRNRVRGDRKRLFTELLESYKLAGYNRDYFSLRVKERIYGVAYSKDWRKGTVQEIRVWRECVMKDFGIAFTRVFPNLSGEITSIDSAEAAPESRKPVETHEAETHEAEQAVEALPPRKTVDVTELPMNGPTGEKIFDETWSEILDYRKDYQVELEDESK